MFLFFYCTYLSNAECIACKADNVHILFNKNIIFDEKCQICSIFNIWKYNKREQFTQLFCKPICGMPELP